MAGRFTRSPIFQKMDASGFRVLLSVVCHLPSFISLYLRLLKDTRVAVWRKAAFLAAVFYALSPLDFIPDRFATVFGIGYLDDVIVFIYATRWFITSAPRDVVAEHVQAIAEKDAASAP